MGCEQFFCRRQQQDNRAGRSNFEPARHEREMVSPPAGACITSFTIYHVLPDLPVGNWLLVLGLCENTVLVRYNTVGIW